MLYQNLQPLPLNYDIPQLVALISIEHHKINSKNGKKEKKNRKGGRGQQTINRSRRNSVDSQISFFIYKMSSGRNRKKTLEEERIALKRKA